MNVSLVRDAIELAERVLADLRRTSAETFAAGEAIKMVDLARLAKRMEEVRERWALILRGGEDRGATRDTRLLTPIEADAFRSIMASVPRVRPVPAPEPVGAADDLTFIIENEIAKLVCAAREQPYMLLKVPELIALLDLVISLPLPAPEAGEVPDFDDVPLEDLIFLHACRKKMHGGPPPQDHNHDGGRKARAIEAAMAAGQRPSAWERFVDDEDAPASRGD